jgi:hypothetical protein
MGKSSALQDGLVLACLKAWALIKTLPIFDGVSLNPKP